MAADALPDRSACTCRPVIRRVDQLDNVECPQHGTYAQNDRLRTEVEALRRRLKTMAREVNERLDWVVRDRTEPDKVLANVSTTRSVLIRELALGDGSPASDEERLA